jgi:hypothetical protein
VKIWVLFVLYASGLPTSGPLTYETKAECEKAGESFKRIVCMEIVVPRK